ncbi:MAG: hypothetical protein ABJD11_14800 [Gemmatimonadota bacterium]
MTRVKLALAIIGLVLSVAGLMLENRLLVWLAMGLLAASLALRLIAGRRQRFHEEQDQESSHEPGH